jgi:putative ABC transport system permease protein
VFLFRAIILRVLVQDRLRSVLTALGVALGVAVMLGIQLANSGSLKGFSAALDAMSGKAALEITSPPLGVDESLLPELSWLREYGVAAPVIQADVLVRSNVGGEETLSALGIDAIRDPALRDYAVADGDAGEQASGTQLLALLGVPRTVIVTEEVATAHVLSVGDELQMVTRDRAEGFQVAGILRSRRGGLSAGRLVVMDISTAQDALGREGRIDRLELRLHDALDVARAEEELKQRLPEGLWAQRPSRRSAAVEKMLAAFHFNLTMLSGIALVVGLFLIYNTVSVSVMTRRREIGMLRTLGVSRGGVQGLFLGEALGLGFVGAVVGVPLAKLLAAGTVALTSTAVDTLYVATAARVPDLEWRHWALGFGIAWPLSLLAAWLPARAAARVSPVVAAKGNEDRGEGDWMVDEGNAGQLRWPWWLKGPVIPVVLGFWAAMQEPIGGLPLWGFASTVCAIAAASLSVPWTLHKSALLLRSPLGRWLGIEGRLAASQIAGSTPRLSISVAALAVALALTVAIAVMVGSFRTTVTYWVDQSLGADLYVRPGVPPRSQNPPTMTPETMAILQSHPEVAAVDGYRAMDFPYQDRQIKLGAGDFATMQAHGRVAFKSPGNTSQILERAQSEGEVLVSESFGLRFKVGVGDEVELDTPKGRQAFRVGGLFYDYSNDSGTLTMDKALFDHWFGESQPSHAAVYLAEGANADQVRDQLLEAMPAGTLLAAFTNQGIREEVLRIFDSTFAITWALEIIAILVAMAGVAATIVTLVLERKPEMRLLRIAGADVAQVRRTIVLESGLIGLVSQLLGLVVGVLLSLVLIHVINPQSFGWSIQFHLPWGFLLSATVVTVAATMLAGLIPARWAARQFSGLAQTTVVALVATVTLSWASSGRAQNAKDDWEAAKAGYTFQFPRDHGSHPQHKIEWWYFTGNLKGKGEQERRLGYQLTFFRIGVVPEPATDSPWALRDVWMAHFAISDLDEQVYRHADRLNRAGPGWAGASLEGMRIWNEDWSCVQDADGAIQLTAVDGEMELHLSLREGEEPVIHGVDGISQKGATAGNASHYYTLARMPSAGVVRLGEEMFEVEGESWMDHEFGTSFLEEGQRGWDWFSAQLDDGSELMLFQIRREDGSNTDTSGTFISPKGEVRHLKAGSFSVQGSQAWISPESGAAYPQLWKIDVPEVELSLNCESVLAEQEFVAEGTPGLGYWEGTVRFKGTRGGRAIEGSGYLEMTGYSGQSMSVWFGAAESD